MKPSIVSTVVIALFGFSIVGCNPPAPRIDPALLSSYRGQFFSTESLANPLPVSEVRTRLAAANGEDAGIPVVLVGQVGGVPNPLEESQPHFPWRPGEASFYLVDQDVASKLAAHLASQGPDHQDCPFCARAISKSVEAMASVSFHDQSGQPIRIGAKELFELQEGDVVAVEGQASLLGGKMLVVDARKIQRM